ncbi:hypothetical protein C6500_08280 [Candidatus Poribacteria bacterium]|nr:MAG: hypothetical protein C6500_08280 [Candidatus Poribacteria bacterium]
MAVGNYRLLAVSKHTGGGKLRPFLFLWLSEAQSSVRFAFSYQLPVKEILVAGENDSNHHTYQLTADD